MVAVVHIHISNPHHQCAKSSALAESPAWCESITRMPHANSTRRIFTTFTIEWIAISYWQMHVHMQLHEKSLEQGEWARSCGRHHNIQNDSQRRQSESERHQRIWSCIRSVLGSIRRL
jgi:hypothetical protein